ncbi:DUF3861 domain-containing protein [Rhodopseudomonas palustris]|uniref:DUF3861 domain-containing protein n=1 Tax=Rhodopseudomonas palustris (strain ATCC BAA-98 / CGA009) TaxID=258594 RepID=Q6NDL3_RHOPA|nr:DUF3861 domain-containing protein [Rhodopseudomonas palustris]ACE98658.1 conserved hypothetical protein [Rhodopseudomonas palustris TIE-1]OPF97378.1 hypothetical protein B1S06_01895 [Rhodopseudomonas palustris]PPQ43235.1 DUF3861 domain-containing protein [Rhodopseudomonas palustris]QQM01580.1 hypothetical protein I8G32_00095 [Rhodopseudomonas palustris]RJF67573.1 DUF3861 family protein [Rhodopseudomonas palustris]
MRHHYEIAVTKLIPDGATLSPPISFAAESHDDLADIIRRVTDKGLFDPEETKAFCVGLKLLGGVMLQHRDKELFKDFAPAFGALMKTLKAR